MATRTPLFVALAAKSKARVTLKKAIVTSTDTTMIASDPTTAAASQPTVIPPPAIEEVAHPAGAYTSEAVERLPSTTTTRKRKDNGPVVVELSDETLGKRAKASVIRSWADAINAGRSDLVSALDYLYGLVSTGFDYRDMSLDKLGEECIWSLLTVSFYMRHPLLFFFIF